MRCVVFGSDGLPLAPSIDQTRGVRLIRNRSGELYVCRQCPFSCYIKEGAVPRYVRCSQCGGVMDPSPT